jgi:hypothetical protein
MSRFKNEKRERQERDAARRLRDKNIPVAPPVFPRYEGRRSYPANPATDAERFERVCREADAEAKKTGMNIVVFKNREDNYFTWEEAYISGANDIKALYTARATPKDEVIALRDGFYARVNGKLYGPWKMKEYAEAGLQTEQKRQAKKESI